MSRFFHAYNNAIKTRPVVTNALTTAFLFGSGDAIAQVFFTEVKPFPDSATKKPSALSHYDFSRTARAMIYGGCVFAFIGDKWYKLLSKVKFPGQPAKTPRLNLLRDTVSRVAVDQLVWAPVGIPLYFSCMSIMEGQSFQELKKNLELNYNTTLLANWTVWPVFQFFNFALVPVQHRLLTVNIVSIAWNCFLSLRNAKSRETPIYIPPIPE